MRQRVARPVALATGVAVLGPLLLAAGPAAHAAPTAPRCGDGSRVVVDASWVATEPIWVRTYAPSQDVTLVCATVGTYEFITVVQTGPAAPVSVVIEEALGTCPIKLVDMTQPRIALSVGVDLTGAAVCVGDADGRTTVSVHVGSGTWFDVDVWANYDCFSWIQHRSGPDGEEFCTPRDHQLL